MKKFKIFIDTLLLIDTFLLTNIEITGRLIHEIFGIIMAALIILHILLNFNWIKQVTKNFRKTNKKTKIMYIIDLFTMIIYFTAIISGILNANELFSLNLGSNIFVVLTHIILGRLAIIIMVIHIGMHLDKILNNIKSKKLKKLMYCMYIVVALIVSIYSIYTLTRSYQWLYMFGTNE